MNDIVKAYMKKHKMDYEPLKVKCPNCKKFWPYSEIVHDDQYYIVSTLHSCGKKFSAIRATPKTDELNDEWREILG